MPGHRESYLVRIWEAVHRVMGFDPPITNAGSNNSSAALLAGISSISTGAGPCDGAHSLAENFEIEPLYKGRKKVILLEIALAGMPYLIFSNTASLLAVYCLVSMLKVFTPFPSA